MTTTYTLTADVENMGYTIDEAADLLRPVLERHGMNLEVARGVRGAVSQAEVPDHVRYEIKKALEG